MSLIVDGGRVGSVQTLLDTQHNNETVSVDIRVVEIQRTNIGSVRAFADVEIEVAGVVFVVQGLVVKNGFAGRLQSICHISFVMANDCRHLYCRMSCTNRWGIWCWRRTGNYDRPATSSACGTLLLAEIRPLFAAASQLSSWIKNAAQLNRIRCFFLGRGSRR